MTAETIHDALTLLPADLTAAADRHRIRRPLRWQSLAAAAACFVLLCGSALLVSSRLGKAAEPEAMLQKTDCAVLEESSGNAAACPDTDSAPADRAPAAGSPAASQKAPAMTAGDRLLEPWSSAWEDALHPTEAAELLEVLEMGDALSLRWPQVPEAVTVRCWSRDGEAWTEITPDGGSRLFPDADGSFRLTPCPGGWVYEITALWEAGTAAYAFRTEE